MTSWKTLLTLTFLAIGSANAADSKSVSAKGPIAIENPRLYIPLAGKRATAAYFTLKNSGAKAMKLEIVSAEGFKSVELHESFEKDGRMVMEKRDTLEVPASGSLELKEGGKHVMLFDPSATLKPGQKVLGKFKLDGQPLEISFVATERPGLAKPTTKHDEHSHH